MNQNQISYAASDVEFLLDIFKFQKKNLLKINKLNNAFELSQKEAFLGNKDIKLSRLDRNKDKLSRREREIFLWREDMAKLENIPTSFLFKDKYLKKLSRLKGDDSNLKSQIIKILGDTKLTENFISNFFKMSFWLIYIFFSLIISFLISKFFNKKFLKILFFSFTLAVLLSIWFKEPGSTNFAPIISIFILESSILESHGLMRILRPLSLSIFFALIFSGIYWFFRSKN